MGKSQNLFATNVRMSINIVGGPMRGPTSMTDANGARRRSFSQLRFEQIDAPGGFDDREFSFRRDRNDAGTVIATVLQAVQPFDEEIDRLLRSDVSDDAAH